MSNSMGIDVVAQDADHSSPRSWALALTSVAFFMVALDQLVVITALPAMQRDLGTTVSTLQWTVNAYTVAFAAGIITAAALGDRLGRRRVFAWGLGALSALAVGTSRRLPAAARPEALGAWRPK